MCRHLFDQHFPTEENTHAQREHSEKENTEDPKQDYSEIFFDLDWMTNKAAQSQTAQWRQH